MNPAASTPGRTSPSPAGSRRAPAWVISVLAVCALVYFGLFVQAIGNADSEMLQALTVAPILVALTLPFAIRIARTDRDRTMAGIVIAAVALKLLMAYVRFEVAFEVYGGRSDARQYDEAGRELVEGFRTFDFTTPFDTLTGTNFIRVLTGLVYAVFGTGRIAGFLVFAWLGFLGLLLLSRAFRLGVPGGSTRRYTILVLFFPSLLYWPSAIGKEAPMMLGIGLAVYGITSFFARRPNGAVPLVAGLGLILLIRPHMALLVFVALVFAVLVRKAPARTYAAPLFRILGVGVLIVLGIFLTTQTSSFLDRSLKTSGSFTDQLTVTETRTGEEAGSSFSPVTVQTPLDLPLATVTVLFRPFPFEAGNAQGLVTSAEGLVLLGLLVASRERLRSVPRLLRTTPYVAFCLAYVFAFVVAFSSFANFGILARQRSQVLPFLLVFVALPTLRDLVAPPETPALAAVPDPAPPNGRNGRNGRNDPNGPRRRHRRPRAETPERVPVSSGTAFEPPRRTAS